jgi:cell division protein FtsQ
MEAAAFRIRSRRFRLWRPRLFLALIVLLAALAGAWLWLRDSSLVAVQRVRVTGQSGPDAAKVRSALIAAARTMTTLDVQMGRLRTAVAPYPAVKDLQVSTQFPHGMRIKVIEQNPVGAVSVGGHAIAVAGDGTLLHDVIAAKTLPAIPLRVPPGGSRLTDPSALGPVAVLAAAPYQMLAHVSQVTTSSAHGVVAQLRDGPVVYFGDASELGSKWRSLTEVLADPRSAGATYIDVSDPARPAAGAGSGASSSGVSSPGG